MKKKKAKKVLKVLMTLRKKNSEIFNPGGGKNLGVLFYQDLRKTNF